MVYFQTEIPIFWMVLKWKMLVCFWPLLSVLRPFGKFHGHLVYFSRFSMMYKEKSENAGTDEFARQLMSALDGNWVQHPGILLYSFTTLPP
jgi:hypothetical protein